MYIVSSCWCSKSEGNHPVPRVCAPHWLDRIPGQLLKESLRRTAWNEQDVRHRQQPQSPLKTRLPQNLRDLPGNRNSRSWPISFFQLSLALFCRATRVRIHARDLVLAQDTLVGVNDANGAVIAILHCVAEITGGQIPH